MPRPPYLSYLAARCFLHEYDAPFILGDLQETFDSLHVRYGPNEARRWYRSQVARSIPMVFYRNLYWCLYMVRNYLIIALRALRKQKGYSVINIGGLAIGLTCFLLIGLYVQQEISYDRFHRGSDRTYRVNLDLENPSGISELATTPSNAIAMMESRYPDIEASVHLYRPQSTSVGHEEKRFNEPNFLYAGESFFDIFSFSLIKGSPESALSGPNRIVLTESSARKYFGDRDPMGQVLTVLDSLNVEVTGIVADPPSNSHFDFDMISSLSTYEIIFPGMMARWSPHMFHSYIRLAPKTSAAELEKKFPDMVAANAQLSDGWMLWFKLMPITDIHLHSHRIGELGSNSRIEYVYIFSAIALFILLIGCINFMNLSTAQSTRRMREVGMRKVCGAHRSQLVGQFIGEALMFSLFALLIAVTATYFTIPVFNQLAGTQLSVAGALSGSVLLFLVCVAIVVGLVSGSYPAVFLSRFKPREILTGSLGSNKGTMSSVNLRRVLVVFQFCISAFLIGGTGVVLNQLNFMRAENLGFEPEKILVLGAFSARERQEADRFMDNIRDLTAVQSVTQSNAVPGRPTISYSYHVGSMKEDEFQVIDVLFTDPAFGETYELDMAAGRDFSWDFGADSTGSFIVNEAFVREVGWTPDEAVGQEFTMTRGSGTIVGVYKDFHYKSLHENFAPMAFSSVPVAYGSAPLLLSLRILTGDVETTISDIENRWKAMMPDRPFEYFFLDDDFEKQYRADGQLGRIFSAFGALAIIIACLGLFGLAALTAEQKTREIGIRKALGASALSVVSLFTRQFLKLIVFAIAIAIPLIWFAAERWLENFAFRIDVGIGLFVGTALLLGVIATLTILVQSIRAALANPIDSLRHE